MSKWESVKLGDVCGFINGDRGKNYPSGKDIVAEGVPFINAGHLENNAISFSNMNYIKREKYNQLGSGKIQKGDLLYCLRGSLGKKAIIETLEQGAIASSLVIIRPKSINVRYLSYCIESSNVLEQQRKANNGSSQPNLSAQSVKQYIIPLPPLEVQRKIAETLDAAAALLALRKEQLAEMDNLIKSVFYEMFGDPVMNEKGWEVKTISDVCEKIVGGGTPSKNIAAYYTGSIPWVTPKDMKCILIGDSIDHITEEAVVNSTAKLIPAKSILMVIRSGILKRSLPVAINTVDVAINQDMKGFIPNSIVKLEYLLYFFIMIEKDILKRVRAVTADNIEFSLIKNLNISIPPIILQNQFAEIVTKIEEQKALVQKAIDESQYLFDSLMNEYFN